MSRDTSTDQQPESATDGEGDGTKATPQRLSAPRPVSVVRRPPGRPSSASIGDEGMELEMRLARVVFWEGSYARRGIDLQRHFDPDPLLITDLDLLAFSFTPQLRRVKTIGECKAGTSKNAPKPLDRIIWLTGLMPLVGAEAAELVTALIPSRRVRELAAGLGVRAMSLKDLTRREHAADVTPVADIGAHGPTGLQRTRDVQRQVKGKPEIERAFWFLRCEVWFLEPWAAVKRTLGLLARLGGWWNDPPEGLDEPTVRWLYAEALSVFGLNLVTTLEQAVLLPPDEWHALASARVTEGAVPLPQMKTLAASFDKFLSKVLAEANAPARIQVETQGAFLPRPPDYADQLIELSSRLADTPGIALFPRHLDLVVHERLVHRRHVQPHALTRVSGAAGEDLAHARRLIAAFLRGHASLPEPIDRALVTDATEPQETSATKPSSPGPSST
ncbi:hypothetical protein [Blastococcus sp. SYSU DS0539]